MTSKASQRTLLYLFLGAVFWFVAAMFIRYAGPDVFHQGSYWLIGLFAAAVPVSWGFIRFTLAIGGVKQSDALVPVATMCAIGLLLDGLAISQTPTLYGESSGYVVLGSAWLHWGVGVLIVWALYMHSKGRA